VDVKLCLSSEGKNILVYCDCLKEVIREYFEPKRRILLGELKTYIVISFSIFYHGNKIKVQTFAGHVANIEGRKMYARFWLELAKGRYHLETCV
jgi:hypothetical protein